MRTPTTKTTPPKPQPNGGPPFAAKVMALRMILAWLQQRNAEIAAVEQHKAESEEAEHAA